MGQCVQENKHPLGLQIQTNSLFTEAIPAEQLKEHHSCSTKADVSLTCEKKADQKLNNESLETGYT